MRAFTDNCAVFWYDLGLKALQTRRCCLPGRRSSGPVANKRRKFVWQEGEVVSKTWWGAVTSGLVVAVVSPFILAEMRGNGCSVPYEVEEPWDGPREQPSVPQHLPWHLPPVRTYSARTHCHYTGVGSAAYNQPTPMQAREAAIYGCIARGGVPQSCVANVELLE